MNEEDANEMKNRVQGEDGKSILWQEKSSHKNY